MFITRSDGLISRDLASKLCGVRPVTISQWISRGYVVTRVIAGEKISERHHLPVAKRENGQILLDPVEVAKADNATKERARREVVRVAA